MQHQVKVLLIAPHCPVVPLMQVAKLLGFTPAAVLKHVHGQGLPLVSITQQHLLDELADACIIAPLQSSAAVIAVSAACRLLSALGSTVAPPEVLQQLKAAAASGPPQACTIHSQPVPSAFPGVPQPLDTDCMDEEGLDLEHLSDTAYPSTSMDFQHTNTSSLHAPSSHLPAIAAVAAATTTAPAAAHTYSPKPPPSTSHLDPHLPSQQYTFPSTLPTVRLTAAERGERYGINADALTALLRKELKAYRKWCTILINLGRSKEYAAAVQHATIDKQLDHIRSFLGFALMKLGISRQQLSLGAVYPNPQYLAHFYAYLLVSCMA